MGVLTDYFAAASDEAAARFLDHGPAHGGLSGDDEIAAAYRAAARSGDRGALRAVYGPRVQATADGTLVMRSKGILPSVQLDTLESLLTGVSYDDIIEGARSSAMLAYADDGNVSVLTVTDELQHALATTDEAGLAEVARPWSQTDEFYGSGDAEVLTAFLVALAELARQATLRSERLYCWVCV